jgi:hypothetical protein
MASFVASPSRMILGLLHRGQLVFAEPQSCGSIASAYQIPNTEATSDCTMPRPLSCLYVEFFNTGATSDASLKSSGLVKNPVAVFRPIKVVSCHITFHVFVNT